MKHKLKSYTKIIKEIVADNFHSDFDQMLGNISSTDMGEAAVAYYRTLTKKEKMSFITTEILESTERLLVDIVQWDDESTLSSCEGLVAALTEYLKDDINVDLEDEYNTYVIDDDEGEVDEGITVENEYMEDYISRTKEVINAQSLIY